MDALDDLRALVRRQIARALASGDLQPSATEIHEIEDRGVRFSVRVLAGPDAKQRSRREQDETGIDPFLPPYADELFVAELSPTHVVLLNKFPVLDEHLLVVTKAFEPQESALGEADFEALRRLMEQLGGLGFYNAGPVAGASQPHKHLQWVPLPESGLPTRALLASAQRGFACASARVGPATSLASVYRELLAELRARPEDPYNLLVTGEAMALIPRSRHGFEGFSTNALGYAGSLLVRSRRELERLREVGPVRVLAGAARAS
jgi:ATP adenylyltransferase